MVNGKPYLFLPSVQSNTNWWYYILIVCRCNKKQRFQLLLAPYVIPQLIREPIKQNRLIFYPIQSRGRSLLVLLCYLC